MRLAVSLSLAAALSITVQAQTSTRFAVYTHCKFSDDLALVETTPLAKGIEGRTVKTIMGSKRVPLAGGVRLMYAYPNTEPLANVKVEQIPADDYEQAKQDLIANFEQILTADDSSSRNYALKPQMNALEIYGLDRKKLEGGVLGIYLFFVDRTHTATTIYFLNQDPGVRKFDTLDEYATLRDRFLATYTGCAAGRPRRAAENVASIGKFVAPENSVPAQGLAATSAMPASAATELPDAPQLHGVPSGDTAAASPAAVSSKPAPAKATPAARKAPEKPNRATAKKVSTGKRKKRAAPTKATAQKKKKP